MNTNDYIRYRLTRHAVSRTAERGFTLDAVRRVLRNPELDYPVASYRRRNQRRLCGRGIVVIVDGDSRSIPTVIYHRPASVRGTRPRIAANAVSSPAISSPVENVPDEPAAPAPAPKLSAESVSPRIVPPASHDIEDIDIDGNEGAAGREMESGSSGSSASVERQTEDVPTIAPLTVLEAPVSKVTPDELTVDLGNLGDGLVGIISRNDVALNAADRSTAGFKAGDMVRAIAISGKDGVVKLSIRKLKQQQRDTEAASAEKAEAEKQAALRRQEEQRRQEEKRRRDVEAAAALAAARRKEEEKRRRAEKLARLKRRGAVAALGMAATLALVLLVARWHRPATTVMVNQKDAFVSYMKSLGAGGELKVRQGNRVQSYTLPQEELINSLPKFADISDEQFMYPKQAPSGLDPDFFKPVMVFTTSKADSAEDEKLIVNKAIQQGLIAVRVESTKYALYAPDNHPLYMEPPAK